MWWSKVTSSHANSHQQMIILKGVILADFLLRIPILGLHYIIKLSSTKNWENWSTQQKSLTRHSQKKKSFVHTIKVHSDWTRSRWKNNFVELLWSRIWIFTRYLRRDFFDVLFCLKIINFFKFFPNDSTLQHLFVNKTQEKIWKHMGIVDSFLGVIQIF